MNKVLALALSLTCLASSVVSATETPGATCPLHSGDAFAALGWDDAEVVEPVLDAVARRLGIGKRAAIARLGYAGNLMMLEHHFPKTVPSRSGEILVGHDARAAVHALLDASDEIRLRKLILPTTPPARDERPGVLQGLLDYGRDVRQVTCLQLSSKSDAEGCETSDVLEDFEAGMSLQSDALRSKRDRTDYVCHVAKDLF